MTETIPGPAEVHRRLVELYPAVLRGGLEEALAYIDPEVIDHRGGTDGDHVGLDAWRRKWEQLVVGDSGFHDFSATVEQNVTAGDLSVNRYTTRGTHTASGRRFEVLGMDMIRVRDGKIVEHWAVRDVTAIEHQLSQST